MIPYSWLNCQRRPKMTWLCCPAAFFLALILELQLLNSFRPLDITINLKYAFFVDQTRAWSIDAFSFFGRYFRDMRLLRLWVLAIIVVLLSLSSVGYAQEQDEVDAEFEPVPTVVPIQAVPAAKEEKQQAQTQNQPDVSAELLKVVQSLQSQLESSQEKLLTQIQAQIQAQDEAISALASKIESISDSAATSQQSLVKEIKSFAKAIDEVKAAQSTAASAAPVAQEAPVDVDELLSGLKDAYNTRFDAVEQQIATISSAFNDLSSSLIAEKEQAQNANDNNNDEVLQTLLAQQQSVLAILKAQQDAANVTLSERFAEHTVELKKIAEHVGELALDFSKQQAVKAAYWGNRGLDLAKEQVGVLGEKAKEQMGDWAEDPVRMSQEAAQAGYKQAKSNALKLHALTQEALVQQGVPAEHVSLASMVALSVSGFVTLFVMIWVQIKILSAICSLCCCRRKNKKAEAKKDEAKARSSSSSRSNNKQRA